MRKGVSERKTRSNVRNVYRNRWGGVNACFDGFEGEKGDERME